MAQSIRNRLGAVAGAALLVPLTTALSSCGGGSADQPADLVPAGAPIYLEVSLDSDEQVANARALIDELGEVPVLGSTLDPEELIASALEDSAADAGVDFSYAEDVEPWLGERGALAFLSFEGFGSPEPEAGETPAVEDAEPEDFVFVLESSDEQIARDSIRRLIEADGETTAEDTEIGGEEALAVADDDLYVAFPEGFVVLAPTEEAVASAVEAPGDEPLSDSDVLDESQAGLPSERLGFTFVDVAAAIEYALDTGEIEQSELDAVRAAYGDSLEQPLGIAVSAEERSLAVDVGSGIDAGTIGLPITGASATAAGAPQDVLGVTGLGDLAEQAGVLLDRLDEIAAAAGDDTPTREVLEQGFESEVGVSLDGAVAALGDASVWVRGEPPVRYSVGFEMASGDPEVAGDLLDALADGLRSDGYRVGPPPAGSDGGFVAAGDPLITGGSEFGYVTGALSGERLTVTLATDRGQTVSVPGSEVGDTPGFADAEEALGEDFELTSYADLGAILDLVVRESSAFDVITGETAPEDFVLEYLAGKLGFAAAGVRTDGDRTIQRFVAGLR